MTDTSNRNRVSSGVPTGGEFATETRDENDDLVADAAFARDLADYTGGYIVNTGGGCMAIEVPLDGMPDEYGFRPHILITDGNVGLPTSASAMIGAYDIEGEEMEDSIRELEGPLTAADIDQAVRGTMVEWDSRHRAERNVQIGRIIESDRGRALFTNQVVGRGWASENIDAGSCEDGSNFAVGIAVFRDKFPAHTAIGGNILPDEGYYSITFQGIKNPVGPRGKKIHDRLGRLPAGSPKDIPEVAELFELNDKYVNSSGGWYGTHDQMIQAEAIRRDLIIETGTDSKWSARCHAEIAPDHGTAWGEHRVREIDPGDMQRIVDLLTILKGRANGR